MKQAFTLLLVLLLVLALTVGCSQKEKSLGINTKKIDSDSSEAINNLETIDSDVESIEPFGIPQKADDYFIRDISDPTDPETIYELEKFDRVFGIEGFRFVGDGTPGTGVRLYAESGKSFILKSIDIQDKKLSIVLAKVEEGTPLSHNKIIMYMQEAFISHSISLEDGTELVDIDELAAEVGLFKTEGIFKDRIDENTIALEPDGSTLTYTYKVDDNALEILDELKPEDEIEYMVTYIDSIIYSIRKANGL